MRGTPCVSARHEMEFRAVFSVYVVNGEDRLCRQLALRVILADLASGELVTVFFEPHDLAAIISGYVGVIKDVDYGEVTRRLVARPSGTGDSQSNPIQYFLNKLRVENQMLYKKVSIYLDWAKDQEDLRPFMYIPKEEG